MLLPLNRSTLMVVLVALALVCLLVQVEQAEACISKEAARARIRRYLQLYPDLKSEFSNTTNGQTNTNTNTNTDSTATTT